MRISSSILAFGALLVSGPALAQVNLGVLGGANANARVGAGGSAGGIVNVVDRTISVTDRTVNAANGTLNRALTGNVRLATRTDLRAGTEVRDSRGHRVGTVQSVHGNTAVVVQGNRAFHVPVSAVYRSASGLVTSLTSTQLQATATANVKAKAHAGH